MPAKKEKYDPPQTVFQVKASSGGLAVVRAHVIGRNGSWYTFRNPSSGMVWTENGMNWHHTVIDAMLAFPSLLVWQTVFVRDDDAKKPDGKFIERINHLIEEGKKLVIEAFEWGKLAGLAEKTLNEAKQ